MKQKQIDLRAKIAHARLDYGQLTSANSPDEDAIAGKIDEISKLQLQLKKNLLDTWFAVDKILTPDQQKIWKKVLQHPMMARRNMMIRMHSNGRMGNGMMQRRMPGMGFGPMLNEGPSSDFDDGDMNMMDQGGMMMGQDQFMNNRMEMMNRMMNQSMPDLPTPDSSK